MASNAAATASTAFAQASELTGARLGEALFGAALPGEADGIDDATRGQIVAFVAVTASARQVGRAAVALDTAPGSATGGHL